MDKVFQIHLAGLLFTIEEKAYQQLKNYLDNLHRHFQNNHEVVMDIESRMAELFQQKLGSNRNTLFEPDILEVCQTLGNIDQMDEEGHIHSNVNATNDTHQRLHKLRRNPHDESLGGVCSGIASFFDIDPVIVRVLFVLLLVIYGSGILMYLILWAVVPKANAEEAEIMRLQRQNRNRRLFRDPDNRVIGGVSAGLANYFGLDRVWIRLIFVASIFLFGTGFWLYIVLWIIVPKASSASDKLMMKGEPVDIKNIEKEILKNQGANKVNSIAAHGANVFGILVKGVLKLVGGFVALLLFVLVVAISIAMVAIFFNLGNTKELNELIGITVKDASIIWSVKTGVLLTILIPCVALLMLVIKGLFKIKLANKTWGMTLGGLFLVGILLLAYSGISFANSVKESNLKSNVHRIVTADTLFIEGIEMPIVDEENTENVTEFAFYDKGIVIDKDKIYFDINNFKIKPGKSDSIYLKVIFTSNGRNEKDALKHIEAIIYDFKISDNKITIPAYFAIDKTKQFSWQEVDVILTAPQGTVVVFDDAAKEIVYDGNMNEADGISYKVTSNGLKCLDCISEADEENTEISIDGDSSSINMDIHTGEENETVKIRIGKPNLGISSHKTVTRRKNGQIVRTEETKVGPLVIKKETKID